MSKYNQSVIERAKNITFAIPNASVQRQYSKVPLVSGKIAVLPDNQLKVQDPYRIYNSIRKAAVSSTSTTFNSGGDVTITLDSMTGSGDVKEVFLRVVITNSTGGQVEIIPLPLCISQITFQNGGGRTLQQINGDHLFVYNMLTLDQDSWYRSAREYVQGIVDYGRGELFESGESRECYIRIPGCFLEAAHLPIYAVRDQLQCVVSWKPSTSTVVAGSSLSSFTIQAMSLDMKQDNLADMNLALARKEMQSLCHNYLYPRFWRQTANQTITASNTVSLQLTGLNGCDCTHLSFFIRPSNAVGFSLYPTGWIDSFNITDASGQPLTTNQYVNGNFNRYLQAGNWSLGTSTYWLRLYQWLFATDDHAMVSFIGGAGKAQTYPFTGAETLNLVIGAAGASEVVTVTPTGAVPASGNFSISFASEAGMYETTTIPFNATAAQIKAAIEALPNFQGTVTVSGPLTGGAITITYGGEYANTAMESKGRLLRFNNQNSQSSVPGPVCYLTTISTTGVPGITSGSSYEIVVLALGSGMLALNPDGSLNAVVEQ